MKIWVAPQVTIAGITHFYQPSHLQVEWETSPYIDTDDPECLVEYAGRICYMSQANPAKKTTRTYIENILEQGHGSVLEHANFTLLLEGISRSCSHEIVRHRAGCAYSQLSQRYVEHIEVVVPPLLMNLSLSGSLYARWEIDAMEAVKAYELSLKRWKEFGVKGKQLKEAARSLLPNCAETKIVMTANARAWRHVIELRCSPGADAEIRRLFLAVLAVLKAEAPSLFGDFSDEGAPKWSKV